MTREWGQEGPFSLGRVLNRRMGRRKALRIPVGVLALVAVGAGVELSKDRPTDDQKEQAHLLNEAIKINSSKLKRDVHTVGDLIGGDSRPIMRNKPAAPAYNGDISAGKELGRVELGTIIPVAIVVMGRDADNVYSGIERPWLAFRRTDRKYKPNTPVKPNEVVFAYAKNFRY